MNDGEPVLEKVLGGDRLKVNKIDFQSKKKKDKVFCKIENQFGVGKYTEREPMDDEVNFEIDIRKLGLKVDNNEMIRPSVAEKER